MSEDSPSEGRPRPQFGEYATPEEQRARIQQPDATFALDAGVKAEPGAAPPSPQQGASGAAGTRHPVDRIVTVALLAYGAIHVVFSAISFFDLAAVATQALRMLGSAAEFTNDEAARVWGPIAAVVLIVGYLVTLLLSVRRLRSGRITWWLPLAGAAATYVVVYVCLAVPLLGDAAFVEYATTR